MSDPTEKTTMETNQQPSSTLSWTTVLVFISIITIGGLLSLIIPKNKISETEKRMLCPLPNFNPENLFSGSYADSLELYYADNFPFRESLVQLASGTKSLYGYRAEDVMIYNIESKDEQAVNAAKQNTPLKMDTISVDSITVAQLDSMVVLDTMKNEGEYVKSVFIYGGRAFQIFGGTSGTAKSFASMVNKYQQTMGEDVTFYCMAIPTPIDYYLPAKYKNKNSYEKKNIDLVYASLDSGIVPVRAFEEMQKHTGEYLFFNTDHHWTGRGAYYAYRAFCASAGLAPFELAQLEKKTKKKFLGSFYGLTHDKRLKENIDSVEYFKLPVSLTTKATYYMDAKSKKGASTKLFAEIASGGNSYSVFLGGDYPLMKVTTSNKTGRKIMIIKDSFGNAFAPYLALHYDEVYIADYRYFNTNIPDFIKQNNITDFIFAHNTFVVNTRYSVVRETALLKSYRGPAVKPKKAATDSLVVAPTDSIK